MSEKVIFEFRARRAEDGVHYEVRHDAQESFRAIHPGRWMKGPPHLLRAGLHKRLRHGKRFAQRHMRQTLDSLESLYTDLYGEETNQSPA